MAKLPYGSGLRRMACLRLRVKDLDLPNVRSSGAMAKAGRSDNKAARKPDPTLQAHRSHVQRYRRTIARKGGPVIDRRAGTQVSACRPAVDLAICSFLPTVCRKTSAPASPGGITRARVVGKRL